MEVGTLFLGIVLGFVIGLVPIFKMKSNKEFRQKILDKWNGVNNEK